MKHELKKVLLSVAMAAGLTAGVNTASAEELSVATFIPPQHHINAFYFDWMAKEVAERSGGS